MDSPSARPKEFESWLPWVNERILLAEFGVGTILEAGLALAIMAWQGIQLSWGNILYEQMKLELMKKHGKGVLTLYSIPYITYLTSLLRVDGASQLPVSTINSSTVVQPVPTLVNSLPTAHLIQVGDRSDIPGPSQPKKTPYSLNWEFVNSQNKVSDLFDLNMSRICGGKEWIL